MLCPNTQLPSYFHSFTLEKIDEALEGVCYHVKVEYTEKCSSKGMNTTMSQNKMKLGSTKKKEGKNLGD